MGAGKRPPPRLVALIRSRLGAQCHHPLKGTAWTLRPRPPPTIGHVTRHGGAMHQTNIPERPQAMDDRQSRTNPLEFHQRERLMRPPSPSSRMHHRFVSVNTTVTHTSTHIHVRKPTPPNLVSPRPNLRKVFFHLKKSA